MASGMGGEEAEWGLICGGEKAAAERWKAEAESSWEACRCESGKMRADRAESAKEPVAASEGRLLVCTKKRTCRNAA